MRAPHEGARGIASPGLTGEDRPPPGTGPRPAAHRHGRSGRCLSCRRRPRRSLDRGRCPRPRPCDAHRRRDRRGRDGEIETAVSGDLIEHVFEERQPGGDVRHAVAVDVHGHLNGRLERLAASRRRAVGGGGHGRCNASEKRSIPAPRSRPLLSRSSRLPWPRHFDRLNRVRQGLRTRYAHACRSTRHRDRGLVRCRGGDRRRRDAGDRLGNGAGFARAHLVHRQGRSRRRLRVRRRRRRDARHAVAHTVDADRASPPGTQRDLRGGDPLHPPVRRRTRRRAAHLRARDAEPGRGDRRP